MINQYKPSTRRIVEEAQAYKRLIEEFNLKQDEIGERVAFCDMGGAYIQMGEKEYVVLTPDMIIGKLN